MEEGPSWWRRTRPLRAASHPIFNLHVTSMHTIFNLKDSSRLHFCPVWTPVRTRSVIPLS